MVLLPKKKNMSMLSSLISERLSLCITQSAVLALPALAYPVMDHRHAPLRPFPALFKVRICIPRRPVFTILGLQIQEAQCSSPEENRPQNSLFQMMQPEMTGASFTQLTAIFQQGHLVSRKQPRRSCRLSGPVPGGLEAYTQSDKVPSQL